MVVVDMLTSAMERLLRIRINQAGDEAPDGPEPLERRSPLGLYFRTLLVTLRKLSFHETAAVSQQVGEWCGARQADDTDLRQSSYGTLLLDSLTPGVTVNPLTTVEERTETRTAASSRYKDAVDSGDYVAAISSLRQFYDYPAKPGENDGAMFPHALLNLATFYYHTGGMASARDVGCVEDWLIIDTRRGYPLGPRSRRHSVLAEVHESATPAGHGERRDGMVGVRGARDPQRASALATFDEGRNIHGRPVVHQSRC